MSIRIIRPGLQTTIQDLGRTGMQQYGVIVSGAMDPMALRITNMLVGNQEYEAVLEITLTGPQLLFEQDTLVAIGGGNLSPTIDDRPVPDWRPVWIREGSRLDFGAPLRGCRTCLAVAGGFDVPLVMNSRSTALRAKLGGFHGRSLMAGDTIPVRPPSAQSWEFMRRLSETGSKEPFAATTWFARLDFADVMSDPLIRVMKGSQWGWFTKLAQQEFTAEEFRISSQSDRMGYRLSGPTLRFRQARELLSEAVTMGTIQVPANGQPIILMADRPTTGGYAKIAQVASVDLPVLAQAKPGSKIRFQWISVEEAQNLYRLRERQFQTLRCGLQLINPSVF